MDFEKFQVASFPRRIWAYIFDAIFLTVLSMPIWIVVISEILNGREIFISWRLLLLQNVLILAYVIGFLMWDGATPGKWLMGLRVVDVNSGDSLSFFQAFVRAIGGRLNFFFVFLPQAVSFFRKDRRQLFDLLAETIVVESEPERAYSHRGMRPILGVLVVIWSILQIHQNCIRYYPSLQLTREGVSLARDFLPGGG